MLVESADNDEMAAIQSDLAGSPSDEELAGLAAFGDEPAFERLFERHRRRVARIAGRFFSRNDIVEDVIQDSFTKMYFGLGQYEPQAGIPFGAWLSRIAVNACYDQLRRQRRLGESSLDSISDDQAAELRMILGDPGGRASAESEVISRDLAQKLLAHLKPEDRLVLTLLESGEVPVTEIARLTGWSGSKVKVRAHRARATLRKVLKDYL